MIYSKHIVLSLIVVLLGNAFSLFSGISCHVPPKALNIKFALKN